MKVFLISFKIRNNQLISKCLDLDPILKYNKDAEDLKKHDNHYIILLINDLVFLWKNWINIQFHKIISLAFKISIINKTLYFCVHKYF